MLTEIKGLHHITSIASSPAVNNGFFTNVLGLRRVKKTVNFDKPEVYHLYYGDAVGSPGTVMTYFPFPNRKRGEQGTGEVGVSAFAVPTGALGYWAERLAAHGVKDLSQDSLFGENRLMFSGPDGEGLSLVEMADDDRTPWVSDVPDDLAVRGFHSASMRIRDDGAMAEVLGFMGYQPVDTSGNTRRFAVAEGTGANIIDLVGLPDVEKSVEGAGSVHHIAFAVEDYDAQLRVRAALMDTGYRVTPVLDRNYFKAIYFRTPGGILFEVATNMPGFDRDENRSELGQGLKLPAQHEHLRDFLTEHLEPI